VAVAPDNMDMTLALRAFGYDVSNEAAAVQAFKRHFVQDDPAPEVTARDRSVLYCLLSKRIEALQAP
jgi:N-acetylmuramoyl-L-alanine amidase